MHCPQGVKGPWKAGIILDWHTVASQVIGENEFGHPSFDTQRSEIGELLYRFKYRSDRAALTKMLRLCNDYLIRHASGKFEIVLPVPPSNSVVDPDVRRQLLRDGFQVDKKQVEGKRVLLVDDVFRSGATLESAAQVVTGQGSPAAVYVLAMTRTRVHR
jgi:competence protein ComFC